MWNEIRDGYPEDGVEVLCLWSWGGRRVCYLVDGEWEGDADFAGTVTHWATLPEPPNSVENKEPPNQSTTNKGA